MSEASVVELAPAEPPVRMSLVRPAAGLAELEEAFQEFENVRERLLKPSDYQTIGGKRMAKRSGWRKLTTAFSVDLTIVEKTIVRGEDGYVDYAEFVVRASAPNGRVVDGWGACDRYERCCPPGCKRTSVGGKRHTHCPAASNHPCPGHTHFSHANHDIPSTSFTRAGNRAASDLFGLGEQSAEEHAGPGEATSRQVPRSSRKLTDSQLRKLNATIDKLVELGSGEGLARTDIRELVKRESQKRWQVASSKQLTSGQASELIEELERWLSEGLPKAAEA
jgi:hypothetical protein